MDWMNPRPGPRSKSSSSRPCARARLWTTRLAFALNSVWPTEEKVIMRKFVLGFLLLSTCGAAWAADDQASSKVALIPDQPRTMEQVIDRVTNNENHLYGKIKEYSPLVETYIQNMKIGRAHV